MKILITGSSGTLGSKFKEFLINRSVEVVSWDRTKVDLNNYSAMEKYIKDINPDILIHLAIASQSTGMENEGWAVNYEWPSELAWICKRFNIKFLFTSTVMVFSDDTSGPFSIDSIPDAKFGYGFEKRKAEERIFYQNPNSYVVRLGWQIGDKKGSNNMIDFFENKMETEGCIEASSKWYPACSFLEDTVNALYDIVSNLNSGLYMLNSNKKFNFFEIATFLNKIHKKNWKIVKNDSFIFDQRMIDDRVTINSLENTLKKVALLLE